VIQAILFDVFGTLLDMSSVQATEEGRAELRAYGEHLAEFQETGVYKPLVLPERWKELPVFPDVKEGIARLSNLNGGAVQLYTFSNGPVELTDAALLKGKVCLGFLRASNARGFKPVQWIYPWACGILGRAPSECLMVTANEHFGDLEGASACGMQAQLIRDEKCPDLIQLAKWMGC
jgi:FMN phosphatase YigB (HAD superfamily)